MVNRMIKWFEGWIRGLIKEYVDQELEASDWIRGLIKEYVDQELEASLNHYKREYLALSKSQHRMNQYLRGYQIEVFQGELHEFPNYDLVAVTNDSRHLIRLKETAIDKFCKTELINQRLKRPTKTTKTV